ncbi:FmdB family zinc ribbon protein [Pelomicrobium sp.]|jgi:putative FmdB family regulatory protein|uniref:FmdB family zinc ribbon protein n=1 Tax=Pelomicrobium sp. TaxID=2815319 RepID=UPI002FDE63D2
MPIYEYQCRECGEKFERSEPMAEHGREKPRCPKCGGDKVEPLLAPFFAKTSRKS